MSNEPQVAEVRRRMATLRRELRAEARRVSQSTKALTDWRYYPRKFPWITLTAAVAAGYLIVPKRTQVQILSPDAETLAKLAKRDRLVVKRKPEAEQSSGLMAGLISLAAAGLLRAGTSFVGQQLASMVSDGGADKQPAHNSRNESTLR